MLHSAIQFGKNTVTKTAAPNLMRVEVEKTRRAFEIGRDCGLFRVPEVLEHDEAAGKAVFERLNGIKPIQTAVSWGAQYRELAKNLGTSLAIIHRELTLPEDMRIPLPSEFALPHEEVFLHGDVSVDNICVGDSWPPVVILDWQFTSLYGGRATYGTPYFDIMWFVANLIYRPRTTFLFRNPVVPVTRTFIESYFQEVRFSNEPNEISLYARRFLKIEMPRVKQLVMRNSKGRSRLLWPRCEAIAREFIESLEAKTHRE